MGILSRLFGSGSDDRERDNDKRQKFQKLEKLYAGNTEMINSAKAFCLTSRGNNYGERGYLDQAILDFKEAIQFKPDHIPAFLSLGLAYSGKGMFQEALSLLKSSPRKWKLYDAQELDADPEMIQQLNTLIRELEQRQRIEEERDP